MKKYFGLRGSALNRAIVLLVVWPAFACYAYNLAVMGGLLTLNSFIETFTELDTITTTGAQQHFNSQILGIYSFAWLRLSFFLTCSNRNGHEPLQHWGHFRLSTVHLFW